MLPLIGGLISGGASLLGSMFSSDTSAQNTQANIAAQEAMQTETQNFNASQAQTNRDFQAAQVNQAEQYNTQMSNTAYQRASADMKAAGLNPMMMFGSGSAASTPNAPTASGSTASVGTPNMALSNRTSPLAGLGDAVGKVLSTAQGVNQLTQQQANIDNTRAQTHLANEQALKTDIEGVAAGQRSGAIPDENASKHAQRIIDDNRATTAANQQAINPTLRKAADQTNFGANVVGNVGDAISSVIPGASVLAKAMRGYKSRSTSETTDSATGDSSFTERFQY